MKKDMLRSIRKQSAKSRKSVLKKKKKKKLWSEGFVEK